MLQEVIMADGAEERRVLWHSRCACVEKVHTTLEKFIAPDSIVKGSWPRGTFVLSPTPPAYQHYMHKLKGVSA